MKHNANHVKALRRKTQLRIDSMTGVNPKRTHGIGIWGNERVVMSIRVDKNLKKSFIDASKALFGSTCNPIECYMATIVGIFQNDKMNGVYPSITMDVGAINIQRNLRERRKLNGESEIEAPNVCGYANCSCAAVGSGVFRANKKWFPLCVDHLKEAEADMKYASHNQSLWIEVSDWRETGKMV